MILSAMREPPPVTKTCSGSGPCGSQPLIMYNVLDDRQSWSVCSKLIVQESVVERGRREDAPVLDLAKFLRTRLVFC